MRGATKNASLMDGGTKASEPISFSCQRAFSFAYHLRGYSPRTVRHQEADLVSARFSLNGSIKNETVKSFAPSGSGPLSWPVVVLTSSSPQVSNLFELLSLPPRALSALAFFATTWTTTGWSAQKWMMTYRYRPWGPKSSSLVSSPL